MSETDRIARLRDMAAYQNWNIPPAVRGALAGAADALEQAQKDALRYRWLRDNDERIIECTAERRGYRSTASDAEREEWEEHIGWVTSKHSIIQEPFPTMDAAIDAAMQTDREEK